MSRFKLHLNIMGGLASLFRVSCSSSCRRKVVHFRVHVYYTTSSFVRYYPVSCFSPVIYTMKRNKIVSILKAFMENSLPTLV